MRPTCGRGSACACAIGDCAAHTVGVCHAGRDPHYDLFSALHGRQHADTADYQRRLATYRSNALHIVGHNADSAKPYRMAINRFADWTEVCHLVSCSSLLPCIACSHCLQIALCKLRGSEIIRNRCLHHAAP